MDAIRFMKMDFLKMKTQAKIMIIVVIAVLFFVNKAMSDVIGIWSSMYMVFMGIILSTTPFAIDSAVADGFIKMLPASAKQRVLGRFLFGVVFLTVCAVCGSLTVIPYILDGGITIGYILPKVIIFLSVGLCINAIQYVFMYFFEFKNQQYLALIRMVPGFIFFFGGSFIMEAVGEGKEEALNKLGMVLNYAMEHQGTTAAIFLLIAVVFSVLCAGICGKREERKEA